MQKETFERLIHSFVRSFVRLVSIYKYFHHWIFFKRIIHPDLKMYNYLLTFMAFLNLLDFLKNILRSLFSIMNMNVKWELKEGKVHCKGRVSVYRFDLFIT